MRLALWIHPRDEIENLLEWGRFFSEQFSLELCVFFSGPRQSSPEIRALNPDERAQNSNLGKIPITLLCHQITGTNQFQLLNEFCTEHKFELLISAARGREEIASLVEDSLKQNWTDILPCPTLTLRGNLPDFKRKFRLAIGLKNHVQCLSLLEFARDWMEKNPDLQVEIFHVISHNNDEAKELGKKTLQDLINKAKIPSSTLLRISRSVVYGEDISHAITTHCNADFGLILVGSSTTTRLHRLLFHSFKEEDLYSRANAGVGVFSRSGGKVVKVQKPVVEHFREILPVLERQDRLSLYEELDQKSKSNIDFFTLIVLSSLIASLGLLQNSPAIIIGAMLVAPLMTPMLGAGLGLVQGNVILVKHAVVAIGNGFLLAMLIGIFVGAVVPGDGLSHEVLSRTSPNVLDLFVALVSGIAAAYSTARPGLMGALPGVAIAAALVPPLASAGICLARAQTALGFGAASLFGINLIAIILASAGTLHLLGVKPPEDNRSLRLWSRRAVEVLLILSLVISFPLTIRLYQQLSPSSVSQFTKLQEKWPDGSRIRSMKVDHRNPNLLRLDLETEKPLDKKRARKLQTLLNKHFGRPMEVEIRQQIVVRVGPLQ